MGQPDDEGLGPDRHVDAKLQTALSTEALQTRLLRIHHLARTLLEEQGLNTLFLALGMLRWSDSRTAAEPRRAPLLLLPVKLERQGARTRFHLAHDGGDIEANLSLEEKLRSDFGIRFPPFPDEDLSPADYFRAIAEVVRGQPDWMIEPDEIRLGFFSFAKLRMYRDLAPADWPEGKGPERHPILRVLIGEESFQAHATLPSDAFLDERPELEGVATVHDADSSQLQALLEARSGRSLIIQGPPGTGKSQTIANLIAQYVLDGKTVLFVAEKLAALEVVKRRLDRAGVGDACLELHSRASNKRAVLEELDRTLKAGRPRSKTFNAELEALGREAKRLSTYCREVNQRVGRSGLAPRQIFSRLVRAQAQLAAFAFPPLRLSEASDWTESEHLQKRTLVEELRSRLENGGVPAANPFWGVGLTVWMPAGFEELSRILEAAKNSAARLHSAAERLASNLRVQAAANASEARVQAATVETILAAPSLERCQLSSSAWDAADGGLAELLTAGQSVQDLTKRYEGVLLPEAWNQDVSPLRARLRAHGTSWLRFFSRDWRRAGRELATLCRDRPPSSLEEKLRLLDSIAERQRLIKLISDRAEVYQECFGSASPDWASVDWETRQRQSAWILGFRSRIRVGEIPAWAVELSSQTVRAAEIIIHELRAALEEFDEAMETVRRSFKLDEGCSGVALDQQPILAVRDRFALMVEHPSALRALVSYNQKAEELRASGLAAVVELSDRWSEAPRLLTAAFDWAMYQALLEHAFAQRPTLASFDRAEHEGARGRFQEMDRLQLEANRVRVALAHWNATPRVEGAGRMRILRDQIARRRGHWVPAGRLNGVRSRDLRRG